MLEITKSRAKIQDYTASRARDKRAAELMAAGMDNQAAYSQAFDEELSRGLRAPLSEKTRRPT